MKLKIELHPPRIGQGHDWSGTIELPPELVTLLKHLAPKDVSTPASAEGANVAGWSQDKFKSVVAPPPTNETLSICSVCKFQSIFSMPGVLCPKAGCLGVLVAPPSETAKGGLTPLTDHEIENTLKQIDYDEAKGECYCYSSTQFLRRALLDSRANLTTQADNDRLRKKIREWEFMDSSLIRAQIRTELSAEAAKAGRVL